MTQRQSDILWSILFVILLALLLMLAVQACTPASTIPAPVTVTATYTASPTIPPPASDTPLFMTPTPEAWQWCTVTAALNVRNVPALSGVVLRVLAVGDRVAVDANTAPVEHDGYLWFALVDGGFIAEGWMICG